MKTKFNVEGLEFEVEAVPAGVDPHQYMQHVIDNCPECQAARTRGEEPVITRGLPELPQEVRDQFDKLLAGDDETESRQVRRARERRLAKRYR